VYQVGIAYYEIRVRKIWGDVVTQSTRLKSRISASYSAGTHTPTAALHSIHTCSNRPFLNSGMVVLCGVSYSSFRLLTSKFQTRAQNL
jgi:hypothetical protein